jgi:hypothetical protein
MKHTTWDDGTPKSTNNAFTAGVIAAPPEKKYARPSDEKSFRMLAQRVVAPKQVLIYTRAK